MEEISTSIRMILFYAGYMWYEIRLLDHVLGRRRPVYMMWCTAFLKGFLINIVMNYLLSPLYGETFWWKYLFCLLVILNAFIVFLVNIYTYRGSVLKNGLMQVLSELNYLMLFGTVLAVFNFLEGRSDISTYVATLMPLDLLAVLTFLAAVHLELKFLSPILSIMRRYEPTRRKLLWCVVILYMTIGIFSSVVPIKTADFFGNIFVVAVILFSIIFVLMLLALCVRYQQAEREKEKFLLAQQKLMELHYEAVRQQIRRMEREQTLIGRQMKQILEQRQERITSEQIRSYLEVLTRRYQEIQAGIYCDDWGVDAVLYHMEKLFRENDIRAEFSFQNYERGQIAQEDMVQILLRILEFALREMVREIKEKEQPARVRLAAGTAANHFLLELECSCPFRRRKLKQSLAPFLIQYHGEVYGKERTKIWLRFRKG